MARKSIDPKPLFHLAKKEDLSTSMIVHAYAKAAGLKTNDAVSRLVEIAFGRVLALLKYDGPKKSAKKSKRSARKPVKKTAKKSKRSARKPVKNAENRPPTDLAATSPGLM